MSIEAVEPAGLVQRVLMLPFTSSVFLGHITQHAPRNYSPPPHVSFGIASKLRLQVHVCLSVLLCILGWLQNYHPSASELPCCNPWDYRYVSHLAQVTLKSSVVCPWHCHVVTLLQGCLGSSTCVLCHLPWCTTPRNEEQLNENTGHLYGPQQPLCCW